MWVLDLSPHEASPGRYSRLEAAGGQADPALVGGQHPVAERAVRGSLAERRQPLAQLLAGVL